MLNKIYLPLCWCIFLQNSINFTFSHIFPVSSERNLKLFSWHKCQQRFWLDIDMEKHVIFGRRKEKPHQSPKRGRFCSVCKPFNINHLFDVATSQWDHKNFLRFLQPTDILKPVQISLPFASSPFKGFCKPLNSIVAPQGRVLPTCGESPMK